MVEAKITLSDTIPAQHQIMRQQRVSKHQNLQNTQVVSSSVIVRFLQTENSSKFRVVFHSLVVLPFLRSLVIVYNQFVPHKSPP